MEKPGKLILSWMQVQCQHALKKLVKIEFENSIRRFSFLRSRLIDIKITLKNPYNNYVQNVPFCFSLLAAPYCLSLSPTRYLFLDS